MSPREKNPYMFHGKPLNNLQGAVGLPGGVHRQRGLWVASWLEYLGDSEVADRIRESPTEFKKIVDERYHELKKYSPTQ